MGEKMILNFIFFQEFEDLSPFYLNSYHMLSTPYFCDVSLGLSVYGKM